jgi:hypothetical protein
VNIVSVPSVSGGHGGSQSTVDRIVLHGTVGPCTPGHSVGIANYLNHRTALRRDGKPDELRAMLTDELLCGSLVEHDGRLTAEALAEDLYGLLSPLSVHEIVDPTTVTVMLGDHTIAYGDGHNTGEWQMELCDPQAGDPARWSDAAHNAMLANAAPRIRAACQRLGVPPVRITAPLTGKRGICGHGDVSATWHTSTHTDPDAGGPFPWDRFIAMVGGQPLEAPDMTPAEMTAWATSSDGKRALATALLSASYFQPYDGAKQVPVNDALTALLTRVAAVQKTVAALGAGDLGPVLTKLGELEQQIAALTPGLSGSIDVTGTLAVAPTP